MADELRMPPPLATGATLCRKPDRACYLCGEAIRPGERMALLGLDVLTGEVWSHVVCLAEAADA